MIDDQRNLSALLFPELWRVLLDTDPNGLGEVLRGITFPGEGTGCYSTFDVREGANQWTEDTLASWWRDLGYGGDWMADEPEQLAKWGQGWTYDIDGFRVKAAWFWDGDGTLTFAIYRDGRLLRFLRNTDCKKSYEWEDVDV